MLNITGTLHTEAHLGKGGIEILVESFIMCFNVFDANILKYMDCLCQSHSTQKVSIPAGFKNGRIMDKAVIVKGLSSGVFKIGRSRQGVVSR